jgi:general secretion pathway protein G
MSSLRQKAFSLFELAVVLVIVGVLATVLMNRLDDYRAQAEELMWKAAVTNIRTALKVRMAQLEGKGDVAAIQDLAEQNPVELLVRPPAGYHGEIDQESAIILQPGNWYYRKSDKALVYLLNSPSFVAIKGQKSLNFKVKLLRGFKSPGVQESVQPSYRIVFEQVAQ